MIVRSEITIEFPYTHSAGPVAGAALAALKERVLLGGRCLACGIVLVPAREWCERCGGTVEDASPVGPGGTVTVAARAHRSPVVSRDEPFSWALIRLDGADTDLVHTVRGEVRAGARVRPMWRAERIGAITDIEWFEPGEPPQGTGVPDPGPRRTIEIFERNVSLPFTLSAGALLSRFYEDVRAQGILHGTRCTDCEMVLVPPRTVCPRCAAPTHGWVPVEDRGVVESFAVVNVPFFGQEMPLPYVLAHIRLDGADTVILHVLGDVEPPDVRTGMRVEAVWRDRRDGFPNDDIRSFRPIGSPG